jgi:hypothetical protein
VVRDLALPMTAMPAIPPLCHSERSRSARDGEVEESMHFASVRTMTVQRRCTLWIFTCRRPRDGENALRVPSYSLWSNLDFPIVGARDDRATSIFPYSYKKATKL